MRLCHRELNAYLDQQLGLSPTGRFDGFDPALVVPQLIAEIDSLLEELAILRDDLHEREEASIERSKLIAHIPADSLSNRLMLRYMKDAHSEFHRSIKTLEKIQSDRKKEAEKLAKIERAEARKPISRNEPETSQVQEMKETCNAPDDLDEELTEHHVMQILTGIEGNVPDDVRADIESIGFGYLLPVKQAA